MSRIRTVLTAFLVVGLLLVPAGLARADNLQANDLIATAVTTPGAVGEFNVGYKLHVNNGDKGDQQPGCNASDTTPATVTINTPAHVTANPSSLVFTACEVVQTVHLVVNESGTYEITASVSDNGPGSYNTNPAKFTLHVDEPEDTTPPVITAPDITKEATGEFTDVTFEATAVDDVDGDITDSITYSDNGPFTVGVHTVTASVFDDAGNSSSEDFTVTITEPPAPKDTTPPVITVPAGFEVEATGPNGAPMTYTATAADDTDPNPTVTCSPASGSIVPLDIWTTVNCTAQDAAGNVATASFKVRAIDTTKPSLGQLPPINVDATSAAGAVVNYPPVSADDIVAGPVTVVFDIPSGSTFPLGITTVGYHATDAHNNTAYASVNVWVTVPCANGLNPPVNNDGSSMFKLGSTIPVKFNCMPGLDAKLRWTKSDSVPDGSINEPANSNPADSGNSFRYDATAGQYIYNLGTKNLSAGTWCLHVDLGDDVDHVTKINLRK